MNKNDIINILDKKTSLKNRLFRRGFCITNDKNIDVNEYPFYGIWNKINLFEGTVGIYVHPDIKLYLHDISQTKKIGLLGHAMNPFTDVLDEKAILEYLADVAEDEEAYFERVNELTGTFILFQISRDGVEFLSDTVGLQAVFYAIEKGNYYVAAHSNLIGDLLGLEEDSVVTELKKARYFHFFGNQLPGNISSFKEVSRLVPNHYVSIYEDIVEKRFYYPHYDAYEMQDICMRTTEILQNTMKLISEKWEKPAISLTGGCDSKTTLACAYEYRDKFKYFSYDSQKNELPDLIAASKICEKLKLPFIEYSIPYEDDKFEEIEDIRKILLWNCGNVCPNNKNDVRKRIFLYDIPDFDVEIKSWASEVGRARYTKRYNGRKNFGKKPTARKCSTFYKFLFFDRKVLHKVDKVFETYISKFYKAADKNEIPWQDQFYWEWHWPSRDGVVLTSEQKYAHEITVPYNNRKLLELLLSAPQEDRVKDTVYTMIRKNLVPEIDEACASIVDVNHTKWRAIAEDFYYIMNNLIP